MICFDQYKIEIFDLKYQKNKGKDYLWDYQKAFCPNDKFFIVKGFRFLEDDVIAQRRVAENEIKHYTNAMEYIAVLPTDTYAIFDFYLSKLNEKYDINYILSHHELDIYHELKNKKAYFYTSKKNILKQLGFFILLVNEETREKEYKIVYTASDEELNNYINDKKIQNYYCKLCIKLKEMKKMYKEYERYQKGKLSKSEKDGVVDFFNNPMLGKLDYDDLIQYINVEINKKIKEKEKYTSMNDDERIVSFLTAKYSILMNYKFIFDDYKKRAAEKHILEDQGIDIEVLLDDITLYRHDQNYFKELLDYCYNTFEKDETLVNEELFKTTELLKKHNVDVDDLWG